MRETVRLRDTIMQAVHFCVQQIEVPGINSAEVRQVTISTEQLHRVAARLEHCSHGEITIKAEVQLFLRISKTDLLSSIELADFMIRLDADDDDVRAVATTEKNWELAWELGVEPIKVMVLPSIRKDILRDYAENSSFFQAAMVLRVSELVGPYVDRIAAFLGYPRAFVQAIGARLRNAQIWQGHDVNSEPWYVPETRKVAFEMDVLVAMDLVTRTWSDKDKQYRYYLDPRFENEVKHSQQEFNSDWEEAAARVLDRRTNLAASSKMRKE